MSHWPAASSNKTESSPTAQRMVYEHDWGATRLGAPESWPTEWHEVLGVCFAAKRASIVAFGDKLELVYNDSFARAFRHLHPWSFGRPLQLAWAPIWAEHLQPRLTRLMCGQDAVAALDLPAGGAGDGTALVASVLAFSLVRNGRGAPSAVFGALFERGAHVLSQAQLVALHELVAREIVDSDVEGASAACLEIFARLPQLARKQLLLRVGARFGLTDRDLPRARERAAPEPSFSRQSRDFLTNLSFQLRTTLTPVLGEIEDLLTCERLSTGELAQVRAAWRSARRLASLVDAVLEFARFEEGAVTPQLAPVDLAQATRRMCGLMSTAFERAGIAFEVDCPPLPELVAVDREMWEKVLSSLLSNALKFTANGAVKVTQHVEDGRVVLTVRDTGAGIDDRVLPQIFDRFFSATPPGAGAQHGAGVGLSLARELVRLHGGDIEVASQVGRGSTVTVQIPYRSAAGAGAAHAYSPDDRCGAADSLSYAPLASDPAALLPAYGQETDRIMVVDDNADTAEYLRELLGRYWPVEVVVQGQRALARAREAAPALILADLVMPGLDGLALVRELRRDARTCQIPVVILSAQADEQTAVEGLHAGAADYIVKPFSGRELVARIEGRLASSRERRGDRVARQSAELELKLRDEFIATMSHELRAPLSAILGWAEILRDQDSSEERRAKALEVIQRNAKAQTRLIADLLDVSRIATGSFRVELEALETVGPMVQSAVESLLPSAQRAGIVMSASVDEPAGPVFADAQRLQQVVWNLVANALKFTPREGSIQVLCGVVDGALRIRVVDTGQGIGHEFLPHVFERFAQERRADAKHGLGLGLAIVHGILERHDGTISVESEGEGRGTAFTVWLPLRKS